jgi:GT2 family glycosyltransferase
MDKPTVSVIVLNWNGKRFLERCLDSLLNQDYPNFEVLLVDNGSTDNSLEFVRGKFGKNGKLRVVALRKNYGFSRGNNIGIKYVRGDYIIVLNNDTEVKKNLITKLVETAETSERIGSVGCKIVTDKGKTWFSQKFTNGGFIVPFFLQTLAKERIEAVSNDFYTNLANSGCAVLYRKSVLDEVGLFDEDFGSNSEDWDLGYRINMAGFKSVYIPAPLVFHVGAGSEGYTPERKVKIYRNTLFTYFKNYEMKNLLTRFPVLMFVLLPMWHLAWLFHRLPLHLPDFNARESIDYFLSIMKAYVQFLLKLKTFVVKRHKVQRLRKVSDKQIFTNTRLKFLV